MEAMRQELDLDLFGLSPEEENSVRRILERPKLIKDTIELSRHRDTIELSRHRKELFSEFIKKLLAQKDEDITELVHLINEFSTNLSPTSRLPKTVLIACILMKDEISELLQSLKISLN